MLVKPAALQNERIISESRCAPGADRLSICSALRVLAGRGRGRARISAKACIAGSSIGVPLLLRSPLGAADRICQPTLRAVDVFGLAGGADVRVIGRSA